MTAAQRGRTKVHLQLSDNAEAALCGTRPNYRNPQPINLTGSRARVTCLRCQALLSRLP